MYHVMYIQVTIHIIENIYFLLYTSGDVYYIYTRVIYILIDETEYIYEIMFMHQVMYTQVTIHIIENIDLLLYTSSDVFYIYKGSLYLD